MFAGISQCLNIFNAVSPSVRCELISGVFWCFCIKMDKLLKTFDNSCLVLMLLITKNGVTVNSHNEVVRVKVLDTTRSLEVIRTPGRLCVHLP
jgi:hypothetical protein